MDPICISSAAILRCTSLTRGQNIAFFVPVALEFLASCLLIFIKCRTRKQHLLLVVEGWIYFILALIELLSAVPSLSRDNVNQFRLFDIGIGITSFLPLMIYTLYLYLLTSGELLTTLPKYVINIAKVTLCLSLPVIIATNEVASVTGITITFDPTGNIPSLTFSSQHDEWLWLFFTALTLAILTAYQATVFSFSFFRFSWILVQQHRGMHDVKIRGVGWVSAGVKLGALETIIGFAGGTFEVSMTRRVMRVMGRLCLYIGAVMGIDPVTETTQRSYDNLEKSNKIDAKNPLSISRQMISNPRISTFQELSPMATRFHSARWHPGASRSEQIPSTTISEFKTPHYLTFSQRHRSQSDGAPQFPGLQFPSLRETTANQRVTVLYDIQGGPPSLHMRFSALEPLDADIVRVPAVARANEITLSIQDQPTTLIASSALAPNDVLPVPKRPFAQDNRKSRASTASASSFTPSVVEIINVPRRKISQRRAEARVILAGTKDETEKPESKDASTSHTEIPESDVTDSSASQLYRPPTPSPSLSVSGSPRNVTSSRVHMRTETRSVSVKSVSDSIQAVQELASQFPTLPPLGLSVDVAGPAYDERSDTPNPDSGIFVHAIGSPADLEAASGLPRSPFSPITQESQDETFSYRTALASPSISSQDDGQAEDVLPSPLYENDIVWASRQEQLGSHRPSSSHSGYSMVTIRRSVSTNQDTVVPAARRDPTRLVSIDNSKPPGSASQISEWADDFFDEVEDQGPENHSVSSRPFSVDKILIKSATSPCAVGPHLMPIPIPRRRSNLPEVIQCWDDGTD